jgi:hypothetical protein
MSIRLSAIELTNAKVASHITLQSVQACQKSGQYHWTVILKRLRCGGVPFARRITTIFYIQDIPQAVDVNSNQKRKYSVNA